VRKVVALDPVSLTVRSDLGWYLLFADRPAEALEECRRAERLDAAHGWTLACLRQANLMLGHRPEALEATRRLMPAWGVPAPSAPPAADALAQADRAFLAWGLATQPGDPVGLAALHAAVGETTPAVRQLQRAFDARDPWLVFLRVDPRFDPLRGDPGFEAIAVKVLPTS
jgi:hypothetical protein